MSRLDEIAHEVMDLIGAPDIFGFFDDNVGNMQAVEKRLQELLQTRQQYEVIELAMYLRASGTRVGQLPTWQPLLNAAIEMAVMRCEPVDDIFFGLMGTRPDPVRNTGGPQKNLRPRPPVQQKKPS